VFLQDQNHTEDNISRHFSTNNIRGNSAISKSQRANDRKTLSNVAGLEFCRFRWKFPRIKNTPIDCQGVFWIWNIKLKYLKGFLSLFKFCNWSQNSYITAICLSIGFKEDSVHELDPEQNNLTIRLRRAAFSCRALFSKKNWLNWILKRIAPFIQEARIELGKSTFNNWGP